MLKRDDSDVSDKSEYHYERQIEKRKDWDKFTQNVHEAGSASEQHTDFIQKASIGLKLTTILVSFAVVLGGGVVSKASLFFMLAQIRGNAVSYCNVPGLQALSSPETSVAWLWCVFFAFIAPELLTWGRSIRVFMMRKVKWPPKTFMLWVLLFETLSVVGNGLLFFGIMPQLDSLRAMMLTNGVILIPSILSIFKSPEADSSKAMKYITIGMNVFSVLIQVSGMIVWPVLNMSWNDSQWELQYSWMLPLGLFLTSFGWWENFVEETSKFRFNYFWRVKINMIEEDTRYTTYFFLSIWKIAVFFSLFLAFSVDPVGPLPDVAHLFNQTFGNSWRGNVGYFLANGLSLEVGATLMPLKVLAVQIGSAYGMYIFGKFACKVNIQRTAFALPISLVMPATLSGLVALCIARDQDACVFDGTIPNYVFFQCPSRDEMTSLIGSWGGWLWILWFISSLWMTRHIWMPKSRRLASTEQMFCKPYYSGLFLEQDITLNRRCDSGKKLFRMDLDTQRSIESEEAQKQMMAQEKKNSRKISSRQYHEDLEFLTGDDEMTRIKGCATMWHESTEEIIEMLKSIFRMDEDYCARKMASKVLQVNDPDNYEWETHIFFDDAFEPDDEGYDRQVNQFVRLLVKQVDEQGKKWYGGRKMKVPPPVKFPTPYGGRLVWTLPGETQIICHLKDKDKIRHKKRWSQCMYMYYFLGHQLAANPNLADAQKQLRARNTFLLALDGDVDFQPDAIIKLVDLMKRNPSVGASCGRIHPTGSGYMQWYQMFEYAIGHWLQKSTEHVMGCVLCSPGCFSLFRGKALMDDNVMNTYTTVATEPRHFVQYDQGEDRWLCTLMLQQGWRVEYSAASDSFTACPEGFKEFYNQRRRWMPSTLANILDLLTDYKRVIRNNNDMSIFYILYQVMIMIGTVLGPGSIFIMLAGSFATAFEIANWTSFVVNMVPLVLFVVICLTTKTDTQIMVAQLLSIAYALMMMAVLVGMLISVSEDGWLAPTTLSLLFVTFSFIFAGLLHPQELKCLPMGIIYYITIPSMYLFLVIYSICNLNVVSWGTREVPKKKTAEEMAAEQSQAEAEAKKKELKSKTSFLGSLFGQNSAGLDLKLSGLFHRQEKGDGEIKKDLEKIQGKLEQLELAIKKEGYAIPEKTTEKPSSLKPTDSGVTLKKKSPTIRIQTNANDWKNPTWIEDPDLGYGKEKSLAPNEVTFWNELIDKYLKPLEKNAEQEKKVAAGLIELRNSVVFSFTMINSIWILTIFLLQEKKDQLSVPWPIASKGPNITYNPDDETMHLEYEYLNLEPIGLLFVIFFAVVLLIQVIGMLAHRLMTLGHIVSSTKIRMKLFGKTKAFDPEKFIKKKGVSIIKEMIKTVSPDERSAGISMQEAVESSMQELADNNPEAIRRMSEGGEWSRGKSMLKRSETIKVLKNRASEYNKKTIIRRNKSIKEPNVDTIEEDDDTEENNIHVPVTRTNTYADPDDLDERDV